MFNKSDKIELAEARNNLRVKDSIIEDLRKDKERLEKYIDRLEEDINTIQASLKNTPDDCKLGNYCGACEFGRPYRIRNSCFTSYRLITLCGRAEACKNFVAREANKDG